MTGVETFKSKSQYYNWNQNFKTSSFNIKTRIDTFEIHSLDFDNIFSLSKMDPCDRYSHKSNWSPLENIYLRAGEALLRLRGGGRFFQRLE